MAEESEGTQFKPPYMFEPNEKVHFHYVGPDGFSGESHGAYGDIVKYAKTSLFPAGADVVGIIKDNKIIREFVKLDNGEIIQRDCA